MSEQVKFLESQLKNILDGTDNFETAQNKLRTLGYSGENFSHPNLPEFDFNGKDYLVVQFQKCQTAYEGLVQEGSSEIIVYLPENKSGLFKECCGKHKH